MKRVFIIGSGGHAREVMEILHAYILNGAQIEPLGLLEDDPDKRGLLLDGFAVLGGLEWLRQADPARVQVICAVGTPEVSRALATRVKRYGFGFFSAISPLAVLSRHCSLGHGLMLFPNAVVNTGTVIGNHVTLNLGATVSHDSTIGDHCNINPGVHVAGNVEIGEGCYVGMGACIIQGVAVGPWSTIGAGAVVIENIPPNSTAVGVPAKVIKTKVVA